MSLNDEILVTCTRICLILKLSCGLFRRYIVLYLLPKKTLFLPTNIGKLTFVGHHNDANLHSPVPKSLQHLAMNLCTSVVDFTYILSSRGTGHYADNEKSIFHLCQWGDQKCLTCLSANERTIFQTSRCDQPNIAISIGRPSVSR